jgi:hypothetical protein
MSNDEFKDLDEPSDLIEAERQEAITNRENFERNIQNIWGHSIVGVEAKRAAMAMLSTKTGMYAKIPLTCKGDSCPYSESCRLLPYNLAPVGETCPVEAAEIELRYLGYQNDFNLEESSFTDKCMVSEIINCDIMMERCKALMAREGVPVIDVVAGISDNGVEYSRPEVSKFWDAYEKASKRRNEAYQLMMATRRDKKGQIDTETGITKLIAEMKESEFLIDQRPAHLIEEGE